MKNKLKLFRIRNNSFGLQIQMMNDTQLLQQSYSSPLRRRIKSQTLSRNDFKGITLKQYFRLVDESHDPPILQQVKEEEVDSSRNSLTQTPAFGQPKRNHHKLKVKTEAAEPQLSNFNKSLNFNLELASKQKTHKKNTDSIQKLNTSLVRKISCTKKPQKKRTQKIKTFSLQHIDLSTMNGFYKHKKNINDNNQIEKRHKMLQKIQADKVRTIDLKHQDVFYITKYANKFSIDAKKLLK